MEMLTKIIKHINNNIIITNIILGRVRLIYIYYIYKSNLS